LTIHPVITAASPTGSVVEGTPIDLLTPRNFPMSAVCNAIVELIVSLAAFMTRSGTVFINRPRQTHDGRTEFEQVPLQSPQTRKWLKNLFGPKTKRGYVTEAELRTFIDMIEGYAIGRPLGELSSCSAELIHQKPLMHGLYLLAKLGPTRDTPAHLLAKTNTTLRQHGIVVDDPSYPATEDAFGRQLTSLQDDARQMGVVLQRHENDRPRTWSVYLAEDAPASSVGSDAREVTDPGSCNDGTCGQGDTKGTPVTARKIRALPAPVADTKLPTLKDQSGVNATVPSNNGEQS
jgi:hypothetical protein